MKELPPTNAKERASSSRFSATSYYNHGMLRVEGDDGDVDQVLRWCILTKEEKYHDVYRVSESGKEDVYYVRPYDEGGETESVRRVSRI